MAYEPTTWKSGDVVTSAKLNKMEGGISSGGVLVVMQDDETGVLDHTWQEIHDAAWVVLKSVDGNEVYFMFIRGTDGGGEEYFAYFQTNDGSLTYKTTSADGYPVYDDSNE